MKKIIGFIRDYFIEVDKRVFSLSALFIAVCIFINYYSGLNRRISVMAESWQYLCWYFVFLLSFSFAYILLVVFCKKNHFKNRKFLLLLFLAPAIFSWKMVGDFNIPFTSDPVFNAYWNQVAYWPYKLFGVTLAIFILWKLLKEKQSLYGLNFKNFSARPYFYMLLIMVPLIAIASTQPDFLAVYPKLKNISFLRLEDPSGIYKLIYELSYGSDFFTIELFFRGFLVLAFSKWFGKDVILPMALFYCTIHFGKPLGECISSFFGGLILGVVTYHTRTIYGGLMVHLGIAWLMELGGYLGNSVRS
ncbi:MAG: CPBP family intramembrane glutamic endopeptidase [Flavisolibacter sp.]